MFYHSGLVIAWFGTLVQLGRAPPNLSLGNGRLASHYYSVLLQNFPEECRKWQVLWAPSRLMQAACFASGPGAVWSSCFGIATGKCPSNFLEITKVIKDNSSG